MVADGYDDCEEDLVGRVRSIVGRTAVIAVELDLHCHLRDDLVGLADLIILYKEYPHVDVNDRAAELFDLSIKVKLGEIRPTMSLFNCQMVGMYPTPRNPLRQFVDAMTSAEQRPGILSVSFAHGFQFADLPHVGAKVLVVTDNDLVLAQQVAQELGLQVYGVRQQIGFESISVPIDAALGAAVRGKERPVVVADQSDNVGGGAPGDATFALRWLLDHRVDDVAMAIFYDPQVVRMAIKAGVKATLSVRLGGKSGPLSGDPVDLTVTVLATREHYLHSFPQRSGPPWLFRAGAVVALRAGGIDLVVSSERVQCFSPTIFTDLAIDPKSKGILVVKSYQHFHAAFASIAGEVIYMAAPGAVPPDPRLIGYSRLDTRRLYPWVTDPLSSAR
jgi:microcystin degradation protein MlrC